MLRQFDRKKIDKIEKYFSDLNNLGNFLEKDKKDCKANKAGTKANVRVKRYGVISLELTKEVKNDYDITISIRSKDIGLFIELTISRYLGDSCFFESNILFDPTFGKKPCTGLSLILSEMFSIDVVNMLEGKLELKTKEIAYFY